MDMLIKAMDISIHMTYTTQIKDEKIREKIRESKRACERFA